MKRSQKFLLSLIVVVGFSYFVIQTCIKAGVFTSVSNISDYKASTMISHPGVEDITVDAQTNIAYFSAHDRRNPQSNGAIFSMNLQDSTRKLVNLTEKFNLREFRPHGISFLNISDKKFLFVISHKTLKQEVVKFQILGDSLVYLSNITSTEFTSPNDILAISENQFFVTNDHGTRSKWKVMFNDFLRIPSGNVVFYDGNSAKIVSDKLTYPNGIAISDDGSKVYVASTLEKGVHVFEPQTQTNILKEVDFFPTTFPPDNIEINNAGNLLIGCHPKLFAFMAHRKNAKTISPSAIIEVSKDDFKDQKTLYLNDGSAISGSSVGAPFYLKNNKQNLLIGAVFDAKVILLEKQ